jgi:electron transfer flavoprotein alpha subunit
VADIGIVGDFREIMPPLLQEIRRRQKLKGHLT